jgi:Cytochrome c oxidase subunit III
MKRRVMKRENKKKMKYPHPYQIVSVSPWPILTSISTSTFLISFVLLFNNIKGGTILNILTMISLIISMLF